MKFPLNCLLFVLLFSFIACEEKLSDQAVSDQREVSAGAAFLEQVKETPGFQEKIRLLNKALKVIEDHADTILPVLLDYKIYYHNQLKEYDSSLAFADRLVEVAGAQEDTSFLARGYYRKSKINFYRSNYDGLLENAFESRRHYLSMGDSLKAARRILEIANAQTEIGDITGSQESATEALQLLLNSDDSLYISASYNVIGRAYENQGFYEDALKEYQNSLRFCTSRIDSFPHLNNIAVVERGLGNYDAAIEIWENLLAETDTSNPVDYALFSDNLAHTTWLKDPQQQVEDKLLEALEIRTSENDVDGMLISYTGLAEYSLEKDSEKAKAYLDTALALAEDHRITSSRLLALKKLIPLASPAEVRGYAEKYIRISDSLKAAGLRAQNAFAKIRFDEERKQQEIFALESLSARQALETQRLQNRNLVITLLALLGALGTAFLIYFFRQKHRKEKIREVHKTETRISKMIHDELANDIYNIMSRLEPVAGASEMDKLEHIYMRTRDISRENSDIDTGEGYADNLIAILVNTIPKSARIILRGQEVLKQERISEEKKIVIYRVLQELMVNMKKHSDAGLVALIFSKEGKELKINYSDNGKGFDPAEKRFGSGLQNVKNRVPGVNGTFTFETAPGKGFKAEITIPL